MQIPTLWIWTWKNEWVSCQNIVKEALSMGYTHIDTAQIYWNEEEVGEWTKQSWVSRESFFLTTKVWIDKFSYEWVITSVEESLRKLWTDFIDLLLLHWPQDEYSHKNALDGMMKLKQDWKIKELWVSNFNIKYLEEAINHTWWDIYNNQIEQHIYLPQSNLTDFCKQNNISVTAYSPLAHWHVFKDQVLSDIANKYNKTISQIALKWIIQTQWSIVIPKTSNIDRLKENMEIFNFEIENEDIQQLNSLPKTHRYINPPFSPTRDD